MVHLPKFGIISIAIGAIVVLGVLAMISIYWSENRPTCVDQLWEEECGHRILEGIM